MYKLVFYIFSILWLYQFVIYCFSQTYLYKNCNFVEIFKLLIVTFCAAQEL